MTENVILFVKTCSKSLNLQAPIFEFGSFQVSKGYGDMRVFFPTVKYTGCDMRPGPGVDKIEDLEKGLTMENGQAALVLCLETLEHVFDVSKAMSEMKRILRSDDGVLIISSLFKAAIHSYPYDYWRFTPECFKRLLADFDVSLVVAQGSDLWPTSIFGIGVKTQDKDMWRDKLSAVAQEFDGALYNQFRYDNTLWRKLKLNIIYKNIGRKKYRAEINRHRTSWFINNK